MGSELQEWNLVLVGERQGSSRGPDFSPRREGNSPVSVEVPARQGRWGLDPVSVRTEGGRERVGWPTNGSVKGVEQLYRLYGTKPGSGKNRAGKDCPLVFPVHAWPTVSKGGGGGAVG